MLLRNTRDKLLMKPIKQVPPMHSLDVSACIPYGHLLRVAHLQLRTLLIEQQVSRQRQRPKALYGGGAHQLVLVQPQQLLAVGKQHLNVPTRRYVSQYLLHPSLQVARCPVPRLADWRIQALPHHKHLTLVQLTYPCGGHMCVDGADGALLPFGAGAGGGGGGGGGGGA